MALIGVEIIEAAAEPRARGLAERLGVPLLPLAVMPTRSTVAAGAPGVKLLVSVGGLALGFADSKRGKPYIVDFTTAVWRARFQQPLGRNHIFRRALGSMPEDRPLEVLDVTAGFGQDAVLALSLGCVVTAVERSPAVAELLQDAVARAEREDEWLRDHLRRLTIVCADAMTVLPQSSADVVYIDPMFKKPKSSAKSPKEMQLLQELLDGVPSGEQELLDAALAKARSRVVVKRPLKARASKPPAHSYKGQSVRYDVYTVGDRL